jgi:hypothetical protein
VYIRDIVIGRFNLLPLLLHRIGFGGRRSVVV